MEITSSLDARTRAAWRAWLAEHHASAKEIWLLLQKEPGTVTYLDAVEEALCFGWIDSTAERVGDASAQRFSPRRPRSGWTELNKERARRLIARGLMTEAGRRTLPDLSDLSVRVADDVRARLDAAGAWETFAGFPELYQRVRLSYVEEVRRRDPAAFETRLANLVEKTRRGTMFGN
jgi:uncharacterized protein YdeI (YjbR/CyaY-like superfamily)